MIKTGYELPTGEVARRYEALKGHRGMPLEFYDLILDVAGSLAGLRVLDVGCGDAVLLEKATTLWPSAELWGVDFVSPERPVKSPRMRIVGTDLRGRLPFRDHCMDLVMASETLEHLPDPDRCLHEMIRILRPGGRILITIPNATGFFPFHYLGWWIPTRTLRRKFLPYEHPANTQQPVDTLYEFREILDLVRRNGLDIQRLVGYRYFRYLLGLRVIGPLYQALTPVVESFMDRVGGQRFAYHVILVLAPCASVSSRK